MQIKVYLDTGTWGRVLDDAESDKTVHRDLECLDTVFEAAKESKLSIVTSEANEDELSFLHPDKQKIIQRVQEVAASREDSPVAVFDRSRFDVARFSDDKAARVYEALREECGIDWPDSHQLVGAIYHSAQVFLTIDKELLGRGREVEMSFGLRVLHPCLFAKEMGHSEGEGAQ